MRTPSRKKMAVIAATWFAAATWGLAQEPMDLSQNFRDGQPPAEFWNAFGEDGLLQPAPGGMRMTFQADRASLAPAGLSTRCDFSGDFEVSMSYQMLSVQNPTKGYGSGVNIWLQFKSNKNHIAKIAHYHRPRDGNVFFLDFRVGEVEESNVEMIPTSESEGRIALKREGSNLVFLAGPLDGDLKILRQAKVGLMAFGRFALSRIGQQSDRVGCAVFGFESPAGTNPVGHPKVDAEPRRETAYAAWLCLAFGGLILPTGGLIFWWWKTRKVRSPRDDGSLLK